MDNIELEDLVYTYPKYNVEDIQTLISGKEEFREVGSLQIEAPPKRGELYRHQKFIKRLMTQYDNQLLIHETGTGKTCSVISVTEHYKSLINAVEELRNTKPAYKRAYILVKGQTLIDQFKNEILCKCTDGDYITEQILNSKTKTAEKSNISRSISKYYTITTYGTFAKALLHLTDEQLHYEYDNCIFIVDESHNINDDNLGGLIKKDSISGAEYYYKMSEEKIMQNGKKVKTGKKVEKIIESRLIYDQLWRLFHTVKPRKVMLLSATPMINDSSEVRSKMNLILPEDNQIPENIDWKTVNLETLEPYFRGLISYVRSLDTGAIPVYQGKIIDAEYILSDEKKVKAQMVIYSTEMGEKQGKVYQQALLDPLSLRPESDKPEAFDDLKRQAANFIFPDNSTGSNGYKKYVKENGNIFTPTQEFYDWISNPELLRELSAKYYEIIRLCKNDPGNCWCYSNYIRGSGAIVLGLCFDAQGFERYTEKNSVFTGSAGSPNICGSKTSENQNVGISKKLRYALLTSETSGPEAASLLELFNSYENRHGEYIKVVIGSPVTRDGLNLANVLQIHLTGPGWNQSSSYQAESRGIRSTSHVDLIQEEKERLEKIGEDPNKAYITIKVYRHAAVDEENKSIDVEMYELSEKKDIEIKRIMRIMKQCSTDCQINYSRNVREKDIDGSATCDYDVCAYKCYSSPPQTIDYTSYDVLYSGDVVEGAKLEIIDIFRVIFQIPFDTLYKELEGYRKKFVDMAVSDLIENKTIIINRYGYPCYLREDRGTLFLRTDYPLSLIEKAGSLALSEYSSNLIGIQTITLTEYNGKIQRGLGNILDILLGLNTEEMKEKIDNLTLENKILLLEQAISSYYINNIKNDITIGVIDKFRNFVFIKYEPTGALKISEKVLSERGKGRGRKPKEGTKFKFNDKVKKEVEKSLEKQTSKNVIYFHNLSTAIQSQTAFAITAKSRKTTGKIRLLNEKEKIGWRDSNEYEEAVYNLIIEDKIKQENVEFDIYGLILEDNKFRIVDKTTEDIQSGKDTRRLNRGRICFNGWKKKELIDLLWKLKFNPFNIDIDIKRNELINYIVSQEIAGKTEAKKFEDDKLNFYYTWYTSGSTIDKICELLENYFEENDRLIKR